MKLQTTSSFYGALALVLLLVSVTVSADGNGKNFQGKFSSVTFLSAAQEVQDEPVNSNAQSVAAVQFSKDFSSGNILLKYFGLKGEFTRLHLHCNVAGKNGPVALGVIDMVAPQFDNSDVFKRKKNKIFGRFTNAQFPEEIACDGETNPGPINNLVSLAAAIDRGEVYWNLHTTVFPGGELRGQVRPLKK